MKTWSPFQKTEDEAKTVNSLAAPDPAALGRDDDCHDGKAGATRADEVVIGILHESRSVAREATKGMRALPKITKGLTLDLFDERLVLQSGRRLMFQRGTFKLRHRGQLLSKAVISRELFLSPREGKLALRHKAPSAHLLDLQSGEGHA